MTNKNISIGAGAVMTISIFLPLFSLGAVSASLFDGISADIATEATLVALFAIGALVSAFLDKPSIARICSGVVLAAVLYTLYNTYDLQSSLASALNVDVNLLSMVGIGGWSMLVASIVGVLFSKE